MKGKTEIDSPFTPAAPVPGLSSAPGIYDQHPSIGPKAADSTVPLKFFDESIPGPGTKPSGPSMDVTPATTERS
jgi:hypothetical protein